MAVRQPYRGNPELKQYHLINDFSGGLDTVSLDEKMRDNELREMNNIELALQGSISNRKGFGELKNLTQWLENKSITQLGTNIGKFKIIKNEGNVLEQAHNFVDYDLFDVWMNTNKYSLWIMFARQNPYTPTLVNLFLLRIEKLTDINGDIQIHQQTLFSEPGTLVQSIAGEFKTEQYVQNIYFFSEQLFTLESNTSKGLWKFNMDDRTLTIISPTTAYIPTPYEVEALGFNVLREDPLADVADQGFGDYAITGTYLTDADGRFLQYIPKSGPFKLRAFQIGANMTPAHVKLTAYSQNAEVLSVDENNVSVSTFDENKILDYELTSVTDEQGYFEYNIAGIPLDRVTSVDFRFEPLSPEDVTVLTSLIIPQRNITTNAYFASNEGTTLYKFTGTNKYNINDYEITNLQYYLLTADIPAASSVPDGTIIYDVQSQTWLQELNDVWVDWTNNVQFQTTPVFLETNQVVAFENELYAYNGGTSYNNLDFDDFGAGEFAPFTATYFVGSNDDVKDVEPLDLNGAKIIQLQNRLMFYKGNSMYFSEIFQYDYVPNVNYILLPIESTDEITHINFFRGVYIIFTKRSIWRMSGTLFGEDFLITKVNDFIGCIAPESVKALNNNLVFLSEQGLYVLTQSYYQEGLENVKKIDELIRNLIVNDVNAKAIMYRDQYWLIFNNNSYDTLKYYFNIDKPGGHPFTTDTYTVKPKNIDILNGVIYVFQDGVFYRYDKGYTDFLPTDAVEDDIPNYMYTYRFVTKNDDFGYATHDKKVKEVYLKIRSAVATGLGVTIFANEMAVIDPNTYEAAVNEYGEIEYNRTFTPNLNVDPGSTLGNFILGINTLGGTGVQVHKFVIGQKAKNFSIAIEQSTNGYFNIEDIGYLFKLGKVKESR